MPIDLNADLSLLPAKLPLGQCPCGADAVWYRKIQADSFGEETITDLADTNRKALSLADAQLTENLCNECFEDAIPEEERDEWIGP